MRSNDTTGISRKYDAKSVRKWATSERMKTEILVQKANDSVNQLVSQSSGEHIIPDIKDLSGDKKRKAVFNKNNKSGKLIQIVDRDLD
jgi:hypothetical protein